MSATTVDELNVIISANASKFNSEMAGVKSQLGQISQATQSANSAFKGLSVGAIAMGGLVSAGISKILGAIGTQIGGAVARLDTLNNFPKVMGNLGISADEAQKSIDYMGEKLKGLPTTLQDGASAVQRFTSANGNIQASTHMFLALNNALLAGGMSAEAQSSALEQISQAYAKGRPDMVEWRSMLTAMPAQAKQLAMALNYADSTALGEALRSGKVSMDEFMATVVRLNREGVAGFENFDTQARNSVDGVQTSIANLKSAIQRGIATILDTIGQANIAGFFQAITNAINAVIPYVVAFVKIVLMAVGALRALFGGKGGGSKASTGGGSGGGVGGLSNGLSDASNSAGNLADNAGSADKKLGGASKQAKKLADQLAGFDEMNILKSPDDSGSGGGSGGGGGGGGSGSGGGGGGADFAVPDFGGYGDNLDKVGSKVDELVDKFQRFFNQMFDFEKIGHAIRRFWDDIKSAFSDVGSIIGDFVGRVIKPFISWAGNDLLPSFLNAVGGAIRFVGAVLKDIYFTYLVPFYEAFLKPIAKWTGGLIVSQLNATGDALRAMARDETAVRRVSSTITALGIAFSTYKVATILSGWVSAFKGFASQVSLGASIFQRAQTAGLSLASSFGAVAGQTKGLVGSMASGLSGLSGILPAIKAGFSSFFSLLSANPMVAVAGAIAILVLSNEELRNAVMDLIGVALEPFITIFGVLMDSIQPAMNIVGSLAKIIGSVLKIAIDLVVAGLRIMMPIVKTLMTLWMAFNPVMNYAVEAFKLLAPTLEWVADVLGKFADWLNKGAKAFGDWLGGLFKGKDTLEENGNSTQKLKEKVEKAKEETEKWTEANNELKQAQDDLAGLEKERADILGSLAGKQVDFMEKLSTTNEKMVEAGAKTQLNAEQLEVLGQKLAKSNDLQEQAQIVGEAYGITLDANNIEHIKLIDSVQGATTAQNNMKDASQRLKKNNEDLTVATQNLNNKSNDARTAFENVRKKFQETGMDSKDLTQYLQDLADDGTEASWELRDEIIKSADEFGMKWDETSKQMVDDTQGMGDNLDKEWRDATAEALRDFFSPMQKSLSNTGTWLKNTASSAGTEMGKFAGHLKTQGENGRKKLNEAFQNVGAWFSQRWGDVKNAFSNAWSTFSNIGSNIWEGLKSGIGNIGAKMGEMFSGAVEGVKNLLGIHSPSRVFKAIGGFTGEGFALGIQGEQNAVQSALNSLTEGFSPLLDFEIADLPNSDFSKMMNSGKIGVNFEKDIEFNIAERLETLAKKPVQLTVNVGSEKMVDQLIDGINGRSFLSGESVFDF